MRVEKLQLIEEKQVNGKAGRRPIQVTAPVALAGEKPPTWLTKPIAKQVWKKPHTELTDANILTQADFRFRGLNGH